MTNPFGDDFTWCYNVYSLESQEYRICFQWLRFQGSEFHVAFKEEQEMVEAITKLKMHYAPAYLYTPLNSFRAEWPYYNMCQSLCYDFDTDNTIFPDDVYSILGKTVNLVITPTGLTSRSVLNQFE